MCDSKVVQSLKRAWTRMFCFIQGMPEKVDDVISISWHDSRQFWDRRLAKMEMRHVENAWRLSAELSVGVCMCVCTCVCALKHEMLHWHMLVDKLTRWSNWWSLWIASAWPRSFQRHIPLHQSKMNEMWFKPGPFFNLLTQLDVVHWEAAKCLTLTGHPINVTCKQMSDRSNQMNISVHQIDVLLTKVGGTGGHVAERGSFHLAVPGLIPGISAWRLCWRCRVVLEFIRRSWLGSLVWKAPMWLPALKSCHFRPDVLACLGAH